MKVLVTGATGFIGSKLVPSLAGAGHQVRTFGRSPEAPPAFSRLGVEHICGDVTDAAAVVKAVSGCLVVYHLAGLVSYRQSDRDLQWRINVDGTRNVMEAALAQGVSRLIHTSSIAGMGVPPEGEVGDESMDYNLAGRGLNYCDSKYEGEKIALAYAARGLPVLVLSPGIIFGEGDTHPHHKAIFLSMSRGWLIGWPRGGVTFCDINDVVDAHLNAMTRGEPGKRYVLGSANLTYKQAALTLSAVMGTRQPAFEIPGAVIEAAGALCEAVMPAFGLKPALTRQVAWLCQRKIFFSNARAVEELRMPVTPFEETVRRTAAYYLGQLGQPPGMAGKAVPGG